MKRSIINLRFLRNIGFLFCLLLLNPINLWARPPASIDLQYDPEAKVLHVNVPHVSVAHQDYIRKLIVYVNGKESQDFVYPKQTSKEGLTQDVSLEPSSGDTIEVLAICNKAGRMKVELKIP